MKKEKPRTWIELDSSGALKNIEQIQELANKNCKISIVLKNNAYGHGILETANLLANFPKVDYLITAGIKEADNLRKAGIEKKILALPNYDSNNLNKAIKQDIDLIIYDILTLKKLNKKALNQNKKAKIHLKIETGLGRIGIKIEELDDFLKEIKNYASIELCGAMTHLADNKFEDEKQTIEQLKLFNKAIKKIKANSKMAFKTLLTHALSSTWFTIFQNQKNFEYSTIRIGSTFYGVWKSEKQKQKFKSIYPRINFKQILKWKTKIMHIYSMPAESTIGYAKTYTAKKDIKVAIIPIGYADGYPSALSNKAHVLVKNQYAKIIGKINMNLATIDVTKIKNLEIDDEVILTGPEEKISLESLSKISKKPILELLTQINPKIKRIII